MLCYQNLKQLSVFRWIYFVQPLVIEKLSKFETTFFSVHYLPIYLPTIMSLFVKKSFTGAYVVSTPRDNQNSLEYLLFLMVHFKRFPQPTENGKMFTFIPLICFIGQFRWPGKFDPGIVVYLNWLVSSIYILQLKIAIQKVSCRN